MQFEYVASGLSYIRFNNHRLCDLNHIARRGTVEMIREYISRINQPNHKFSILFNAYTEKNMGKIVNSSFRNDVNNIYADSGGLQIVTKGEILTPELKSQVYETQAECSTIAMSFDEIPVVLKGNKSTFHDVSSRYYDPDILEEKARQSGRNLKKQILYFLDKKSESMPMIILQGNDLDSYQRWLDYVCEEVGREYLPYIKGISSGASALGQKMLEDVERMFILSVLDIPEELSSKHIHLLGVGSLSRFFPLAVFVKNNLFDSDKLISYDSTTHTSGISLGKYYFNHKNHNMKRYSSKNILQIVDDINKNMEYFKFPEMLYQHFDAFILNPNKGDNGYCKDLDMFIKHQTIMSFFISEVFNFKNDIDMMFSSNDFYYKMLHDSGYYIPFKALESCRDKNDFELWKNEFGGMLPTNRVASKYDNSSSLEGFF